MCACEHERVWVCVSVWVHACLPVCLGDPPQHEILQHVWKHQGPLGCLLIYLKCWTEINLFTFWLSGAFCLSNRRLTYKLRKLLSEKWETSQTKLQEFVIQDVYLLDRLEKESLSAVFILWAGDWEGPMHMCSEDCDPKSPSGVFFHCTLCMICLFVFIETGPHLSSPEIEVTVLYGCLLSKSGT